MLKKDLNNLPLNKKAKLLDFIMSYWNLWYEPKIDEFVATLK